MADDTVTIRLSKADVEKWAECSILQHFVSERRARLAQACRVALTEQPDPEHVEEPGEPECYHCGGSGRIYERKGSHGTVILPCADCQEPT